MDCVIRIFFVGLFGVIIGMIGALAMIEMINRSNDYISKESEHPPDGKNKNNKGGNSDG